MPKEDKGTLLQNFLRNLDRRMKALEKEMGYLREHGITAEEQKIVLDKAPQANGGGKWRFLLGAWTALNTILLLWCIYAIWNSGKAGSEKPASAAPREQESSKDRPDAFALP